MNALLGAAAGIREQQVLKGFALLDIVQQLHACAPTCNTCSQCFKLLAVAAAAALSWPIWARPIVAVSNFPVFTRGTVCTSRMLCISHAGRQFRWVFRVGMPGPVRIELVEAMADVEHRLAVGTSEKLQLGALVAAFVTARAGIAAAAT